MRFAHFAFLAALLLPIPEVQGQHVDAEAGRPLFVQHYLPGDYELHPQNWDITQDHRGIIYVANWTGLLEFDGVTWRTYDIPNLFVRSVDVFRNQVCVGGTAEFGCFRPDEHGGLEYVSLIPELGDLPMERGDVWTTLTVDNGVVFQSFQRLYKWDGTSLQTWDAVNQFHKGFYVAGRYFVRDEGIGLMELVNNELLPVAGGEQFADERIDAMIEMDTGILMVTRTSGIVRYVDGWFESLNGSLPVPETLGRVYHGTALSDGTAALAMHGGRVLIIDQNGTPISILDENVGIERGTMVLSAFNDRQNGLWLALDNGIMRVDLPSPVTVFDVGRGLGGQVASIGRYNGRLWVGTSQGLFSMSQQGPTGPRFEKIEGVSDRVWHLFDLGAALFIASNEGTLVYEEGYSVPLFLDYERSFVLRGSVFNDEIVYAGVGNGVARISRGAAGWVYKMLWESPRNNSIRSLVEKDAETLWVGTLSDGVFRLNLSDGILQSVDSFGIDEGLPTGVAVVWLRDNSLNVVTSNGVYGLDPADPNRFVAVESPPNLGEDEYFLFEGHDKELTWVMDSEGVRVYESEGDELVDVTSGALRVGNLAGEGVFGMDQEVGGYVWMYGNQGLFRYNPNIDKDYETPYHALVRQVWVNGDSLLFKGYNGPGFASPRLGYADNDLRFNVSATTYNSPENTLYSYRLEGFDSEWSAWSTDSYKEYTNLPNGRYIFQVRAVNAHGVESTIGFLTFSITPPWYRTIWAYLGYLIGFGLLLWSYGQWRAREHRLEAEREREVRAQVETANKRLKEANRKLVKVDKLKDDLLANTSHELRTPLTSILGFATILEEELEGELNEFAVHIRRSGHRLFKTVDSLLDMARLRADSIELDPEDFDMVEVIERVLHEHSQEISRKGLYVSLLPRGLSLPVCTDRNAVERIINNIVDNAVKFTESGGITLLVDADDEDVYITIKDTGIGIRKEFLPSLFKEFNQASSGHARSHEGSGLGLSIAHRFIKCLNGAITYKTAEGEGTTFNIRLPRTIESNVGVATVRHTDELHRVLVVSPEYPLRSELAVALASTDFEVVDSAVDAMTMIEELNPHIILVDAHAQSESIPVLLDVARANHVHMIIAIPSMFDTVPIEWREEYGATILRGPIPTQDLHALVESLAQSPVGVKDVMTKQG